MEFIPDEQAVYGLFFGFSDRFQTSWRRTGDFFLYDVQRPYV